MSFDYSIDADPSKALSALEKVDAGNKQVEAGARRIGEAMTGALGGQALQNAQGQFLATGVAAKSMGDRVDAAMEAMDREESVLQRIRGPAQQYQQDLTALDSLLEKNTITTNEYADAVTRLNQKLEKTPAAPSPAKEKESKSFGSSVGEELGSKIGMVGGALAIGGAIETVKQLAEIDDKYTELSNSALRFATAGRTTNDILEEQRTLANSLHVEMGTTLEAYERIKDATEASNLTHAEELRLTKTLGEAAILNGRSMGESAQAILGLKVAFETGQDPARQLRAIMKDYPALSDQMSESLGVTEQQMLSMAKSGKLGFNDLAQAMTKSTDEIDEKFGNRAVTWGQRWNEMKDAIEKPINIQAMTAPFGTFDDQLNRLIDDLDKVRARTEAKQFTAGVEQLKGIIQDTVHQMSDIAQAPGFKDEADQRAKVLDAKLAIDNLVAAHKKGTYSAEEYRTKLRALEDEVTGGPSTYTKLARSVEDGNRAYTEGIAAASALMLNGTYTAHQYYLELEKLSTAKFGVAFKGPADNDALQRAVAERNGGSESGKLEFNDLGRATHGLRRSELDVDQGLGQTDGAGKYEAPIADQDAKAAMEMYKQVATPAEKYADDLEKINDLHQKGDLDGTAYDRVVGALSDKYKTILTPLEQYQAGIKKLEQEMAVGLVSQEAYDDKLRELKLTAGQGSFTDGITQGLKDIRKETQGAATEIATALKAAFDGVNNSIVELVTTGKTDWSKLATTIEGDLTKFALHKAESALFDSATSSATAAAGGAATGAAIATGMEAGGTAAGLTITAAMEAGGVAAAATIGTAMAAGGAAGGAAQGLEAAVPLAFAGGGQFVVGGPSGTDKSLQAFWATRGERVTVETPDQQRASVRQPVVMAAHGGGSGNTVIRNVFDSRDLLDAVGTNHGGQTIMNSVRKNVGAFKSIFGRNR